MSHLVEKIFAIHDSLVEADLRHGFGGAIALAYCIEEPRGTRDLDLNIFVPPFSAGRALQALPDAVEVEPEDLKLAERNGQVRAWWDDTPVDVFLSSLPLHEVVAKRLTWVPLLDRRIPIVDCTSLVVFKALVDRKKDWVDIEAIAQTSSKAIVAAAETVADLVPDGDPRVDQLWALRDWEGRVSEVPSLKKILNRKNLG